MGALFSRQGDHVLVVVKPHTQPRAPGTVLPPDSAGEPETHGEWALAPRRKKKLQSLVRLGEVHRHPGPRLTHLRRSPDAQVAGHMERRALVSRLRRPPEERGHADARIAPQTVDQYPSVYRDRRPSRSAYRSRPRAKGQPH